MIRVGQKLQEVRKIRGLTIEDVAKATRIRTDFLKAIEEGSYTKLPSSAYAQGFIRNYTEFLGLPTRDFVALFKREYDEKVHNRVLPEGFTKKSDFPTHRIKIKDTLYVVIGIVVVMFGYIGFQYRYAFINPPLTVITPKEHETVSANEVIVSGKTDPSASLIINNAPVSLDPQGSFQKRIDVFQGIAVIRITAVSRFGKKEIIERKITVK